MKAMEISLTGLDVEWRRLEVIAQNLANVNTLGTATSGPYRAMRLVSGPKTTFATNTFESHLAPDVAGSPDGSGLNGVAVYGIEPVGGTPRRVREPGNPLADADGYVTYPDVDHAAEMVLMVKTTRAYEANMVAMSSAREMYMKALDMGR